MPTVFFFLNYNFFSCRKTGETTKALNLGSYNYLGFAENVGPCAEAAEESVQKFGLAGCSSRHEYGKWFLCLVNWSKLRCSGCFSVKLCTWGREGNTSIFKLQCIQICATVKGMISKWFSLG